MNRHSAHLIVFELSAFAFFVLFNYYTRTKTDRNPLAYVDIKSDVATVNYMLCSGSNIINAPNRETSLALSPILKNDEIFNLPINTRCLKHDAQCSFIRTGNGSKENFMNLMPAFHKN